MIPAQKYSIESPLSTNPLREAILNAFPVYFDSSSSEQQITETKTSILELEKILKNNSDNPEAVQLIKDRLRISIFQNPYPESRKIFEQFFLANYECEDQEEQIVSSFIGNNLLPSIQELGLDLFGSNSSSSEHEEKQGLSWPTIQNKTTKEEFSAIIADIVNWNQGRVPHLERVLCWFPDFLCKFHELMLNLFENPGPIPVEERYFIAILACSNYGCEYMHSRLSSMFLNVGGSMEWLEDGLEKTNPKLIALANCISKLAYNPNEILKNPQLIQVIDLSFPIGFQELLEKGWQKGELVQAVFITAFFHGVSCLCLALGLKSELDQRNENISIISKTYTPIGSNLQSPRSESAKKHYEGFANREIEKLLEKITQHSSDRRDSKDDDPSDQFELNSPLTPLNLQHSLQQQQQQQQQQLQQSTSQTSSSNPAQTIPQLSLIGLSPFISPKDESAAITKESTAAISTKVEALFEKFNKFIVNRVASDDKIVQSLRYSEFNFNAHGSQIASQYTADLVKVSKDLFEEVRSMTNKNFNSTVSLDTDPFRKAVKLYIQNIFGYTHYDADYKSQMNALLPIPLKGFLKMTVKTPFSLKAEHLKNVNVDLMPSEKAHIVLIAALARVEIELAYFLHPFQKF